MSASLSHGPRGHQPEEEEGDRVVRSLRESLTPPARTNNSATTTSGDPSSSSNILHDHQNNNNNNKKKKDDGPRLAPRMESGVYSSGSRDDTTTEASSVQTVEKHRWKYDKEFRGSKPGATAVAGKHATTYMSDPERQYYYGPGLQTRSEETVVPYEDAQYLESLRTSASSYYRGTPAPPGSTAAAEQEQDDDYHFTGPVVDDVIEAPARRVDDVTLPRKKKKIGLCLILVAVLVVLGCVGAGIGVALSSRDDDDNDSSSIKKIEDFRELLAPVSGDRLEDPNSPQTRALKWIATEDEASMEVTDDQEVTQQRYGAAVLYFALNGEAWERQLNFLSKTGICQWNDQGSGILCTDDVVTELHLSENNLVGTIPEEISVLSTITFLNASWNLKKRRNMLGGISGSIPSELLMLTDLKQIDLSHNRISGNVTPLLESLNDGLLEFDLNNNELTGILPNSIDRYSNLTRLELFDGGLMGTLPTHIGRLASLLVLDVGSNRLTGTIATELAHCSNLTRLDLGGNSFGGEIPTELGLLRNLDILYLCDTNLVGNADAICSADLSFTKFAANVCNETIDIVCDCCTECCLRV